MKFAPPGTVAGGDVNVRLYILLFLAYSHMLIVAEKTPLNGNCAACACLPGVYIYAVPEYRAFI